MMSRHKKHQFTVQVSYVLQVVHSYTLLLLYNLKYTVAHHDIDQHGGAKIYHLRDGHKHTREEVSGFEL